MPGNINNKGKEAFDKGVLLFRSNELSKAEKKFLLAVKYNYKIADSYFKLAIISVFGDNLDQEKSILKAITLLDKVIDNDPIYCDAYSFRAELKSRLGFHEAGLIDIDVALKLFPDSIENLIRCAGILLELSHFNSALNTINKALQHEPLNIEASLLSACILFEMEELEKGRTILWELLASNTKDIELLFKVISIYSLFDMESESINACKLIIKHNPDNFTLYEFLIELLSDYGLVAEAIKVINKCQDLFRNVAEIQNLTIRKVRLLADSFDFKQAFETLREMQSSGYNATDINHSMGYVYCAKKEPVKGIQAFTKALKEDPHHLASLIARGKAYISIAKHQKAKKDLLTAFKHDNSNKEVNHLLLTLFVYDGELDRADEIFAKTIKIEPDAISDYVIYARLLTVKSEYSRAISILNLAMEQPINELDIIYVEKARVYLSAKENSKVIENLKLALEIDEFCDEANHLMAVYLYEKDDFSGAIYHCEIEIEHNATFSPAYGLLGEIYYVTENIEDSIEFCTKAISLDSNFDQAIYCRGLAYLNLKEIELAKNDFITAANLGNKAAIQALKSIED